MYALPTSIVVEEQSFPIHEKGDFRMVLDCFSILSDGELTKDERLLACLTIFLGFQDIESLLENVYNLPEAIHQMFLFFNLGKEEKQASRPQPILIDWNKDESLICSAVNNVIKTEIRSLEYLHWWTFLGYYTAIGDCALSNIVSIRNKIVTHKKLEKYEQEFRRDNPQYFDWNWVSLEQQEADKLAFELWNKS